MSLKYKGWWFLCLVVCIAIIMVAGKWAWERSINPYMVVVLAVALVFLLVYVVAVHLVQRDRKVRNNIRALNERLLVLERERDVLLHLRLQASSLASALETLEISTKLPAPQQQVFLWKQRELMEHLRFFRTEENANELLEQDIKTATDFIEEVTQASRRADMGLADVA